MFLQKSINFGLRFFEKKNFQKYIEFNNGKLFGKYSKIASKIIDDKRLENIFSEQDFKNNSIFSYYLKIIKEKEKVISGNINDN